MRSLRHWVTVAGIALIALIIATDSYEAWQDYRRVISDNEHLQVALSRALTEQTARTIQEADLVLSAFGSRAAVAGGVGGLRQRLQSRITRLPFVSSAAVAGEDGRLLASTRDSAGDARGFAGQRVFTVPRDDVVQQLYIDQPTRDADDSDRAFALSRRISKPDGSFAGVIVARVASNYLHAFYARVNVTPDATIRLSRQDGVVLAQYPHELDLNGAPLRAASLVTAGSPERVNYHSDGGREAVEVVEKIPEYPLVVVVSRSLSSVLAPWIQEELSSAARTLALALLAGLLLLALRVALDRQQRMDRETHRLEQELAAIQRVDALGFLAASVAHDFNNVLTAIIGYAELAQSTAQGEPQTHAHLVRLLAASERARLLVRRVLTFDPRRSLSYRPILVKPILSEVVEQIGATLPAHIELTLQAADPLVTVVGDAMELYQVAMNLCTNAVHAMPTGGTLQIVLETVRVDEPKRMALGQLLPGNWVRLSIMDTGVGLAAEQTVCMFEPFYTTRQVGHGTGIGLTVVRNVISLTKGALEVDSHLGVGTRMSVYWPAVDCPPPRAARLLRPNYAAAGETILVVDDERELVTLTEELLASLSYEPVGFSDSGAALSAFASDPLRFDAVLTDDRMAPMRGLDFAREIRAIAPHMPVILMTGHRDAETDARAKREGILEIIDKPLRVQTLSDALSRQLIAP